MSDIDNDLMVNIFERLPLKSIIRFRSLSKYWHSRIASREFIRNHTLRCSKNTRKVLITHLRHCTKYSFKDVYSLHPGDQLPLGSGYIYTPGIEFPYQYEEVVGSQNGVLCLRGEEISLWNLSIRRRVVVPCLKISPKVAYGFGFDPVIDDYKIVGISYGLEQSKAYIYSLKTKSWRGIPSPSTRFHNVESKACFFNGILHWLVGLVDGSSTKPSRESPSRFILTMDLSRYVFGHILLPEPGTISQLTSINGCLALISWKACHCWIWVMKEYGEAESWSAHSRLEAYQKFEVSGVVQPTSNSDILAYYEEGPLVYDVQTREFKWLMRFGPCCSEVGNMEPFVESLELLDKEGEDDCGETALPWGKDFRHFSGCFRS